MKKVSIVAALAFVCASAPSFGAEDIVGSFKSLDGKFKHRFEASGDYSGQVQVSGNTSSVAGVYESFSGISDCVKM
jgi:hypothetical protein